MRRPWIAGRNVVLAFSVLWGVIEPALALLTGEVARPGWDRFLPLVVVAVAVGAVLTAEPASVKIRIPGSRTEVEIAVGDLFESPHHKVIPVNEYFDAELGDLVAPNSVHGQCIRRLFGGDSNRFAATVDEALKGKSCHAVPHKRGRTNCYALGTVAVVDYSDHRLFLVAVAHTDTDTLQASSAVEELWTSLMSLWQSVRKGCNAQPVAMPLVGGGLARIGLPSSGIASLILLSLFQETRANKLVTERVLILVPESVFRELSLRELVPEWSGQ